MNDAADRAPERARERRRNSARSSKPGACAWNTRWRRVFPQPDLVPARLHEAMRYSVLGGGKRIRPALLFATARTLGLSEDEVEAAACAIELVHVYSLVHDDLPAMDDDDLRRGRPTCHKAYDEATALLVGDALQPLAFQLLAVDPALPASPAIRLRLIDMLAQAIGTFGMAGGQAIDLAVQGMRLDIGQVEDMHARKTGAVIRASVLMAAECAPSLDTSLYGALNALRDGRGPRLPNSGRPPRRDRRCARRWARRRAPTANAPSRRIRRSSASRLRSSACACCTIRRSMRSRRLASVRSRCAPWPIGCCRGSTDAR